MSNPSPSFCDISTTFLTLARSFCDSAGCFEILCGSTTVSRSGAPARRAPRMAAALVPPAPEVYT
eukprot:scaffold1307_cov200-Pinguiococcus_pyrenoidosus.AAC.31